MIDKPIKNGFIRTINTTDTPLVWHRDRKDRIVKLLKGTAYLQFDNEVPFKLNRKDYVFIKKETYHRVITKSKQLIFEIREEE